MVERQTHGKRCVFNIASLGATLSSSFVLKCYFPPAGLPPLAPRRLYNANVARQAVASPTSSSDTAASSSTAASTPPLPTAASVQAFVVNTVTGSSTVQPFRRRQTVGSSAGWLTQVAQLVPTNRNVRFSLTTDPEVAVGVYPVRFYDSCLLS